MTRKRGVLTCRTGVLNLAISVLHSGEVSFNWEGTVGQEGKVQEFEFSLEH